MNYRQIKPSASVARFIEFYWILEHASPANSIQRIVPDGRSGIILNFRNPFESLSNDTWQRQAQSFFVGQITAPLLLRPCGPAAMLGVQFRPHGAAQFLGLPMSELNNSAIPLESLSRGLFRQLEPARDFSSPSQAVAALDPIFQAFVERSGTTDAPLSFAVSELDRSAGSVSISHLAKQIGWSARQLQRRFKQAVGISPKLFARMQRFQGIFRAMEGSRPDWLCAAIDCGYFDQSHLIRDFREFAGKTPTALLDQEIDLTRRFVQAAAMSHFSKTAGATAR